jgi:hypothetical protein
MNLAADTRSIIAAQQPRGNHFGKQAGLGGSPTAGKYY